MTGRGTPVTAPEPAELLMCLLQGLSQGSHQPHRLGEHLPLSQWKTVAINSPSIPLHTQRELLPTEAWDLLWKVGKNMLGSRKTYYGMFRGKTRESGKERSNWTGEKQVWKNTEEWG